MTAVMFAGCICSRDSVTETAYASMVEVPDEIAACILGLGCTPLCHVVFRIGVADIQRCELVAVDGLQQLRGVRVQVTYVREVCAVSASAEGGYDDSTDDGWTDDDSDDDSTDDGWTDDDSDDDSGDDGSGDDGSGDEGSDDDGSRDDGDDPLRGGPLPHRTRHI